MTRFRWALTASSMMAAFHLFWLITKIGGTKGVTAASDLIQIVPPLVASIYCAARARREPRGGSRRAWGFLAASQASWSLGAATWTLYEVVLRVEVPFPSVADLGFLSGVVLAVVGLLMFPAAPQRIFSRLRTVLDGAIIGGSVLFISWTTVLGPTYREHEAGLLQQVLTLAYPLSDVVIVTAAVFVVARAGRGNRIPLGLVAAGLLTYGLADSSFIFLDLRGAYSTGSLIDLGWTVGPLLIFLGALAKGTASRVHDRDEVPHNSILMLPYVPAVLALGTAGSIVISHGKLESFLVWNGLAVVFALALRQLMILLENVSLSRNLEARVEARTAELSASEERFRSLVQNSSDLIAIVSQDAILSYVSQSVERVLGYTPAAMKGTDFMAHVHEKDRHSVLASFAGALNQPGLAVTVECRVLHRGGHASHLEIVMTNLLLDASVRGIVLNARDVTERRKLEEQLSHQAFHDPLTGLANRAVFRDRVEHALRRTERMNEPVAVLFLDLDGFKAVNDSLGHAAGDQLLVEFGKRLSAWSRPGDTVARLGETNSPSCSKEYSSRMKPSRSRAASLRSRERNTSWTADTCSSERASESPSSRSGRIAPTFSCATPM